MSTKRPPIFNFEHDLPIADSFSLHWLANRYRCSVNHFANLVRAGEFGKKPAADLRAWQSSKAMFRLPRSRVVTFLNQRKDLAKIAKSSPRPKPRKKSARKRSKKTQPASKRS